jgi:hypothetical protein
MFRPLRRQRYGTDRDDDHYFCDLAYRSSSPILIHSLDDTPLSVSRRHLRLRGESYRLLHELVERRDISVNRAMAST